MWVVIFTMIFVFLIFRTLCGTIGSGVKYVDKTIKEDKFKSRLFELLSSVNLLDENGAIDADKINCRLENAPRDIQLLLTKDMKIHVIDGSHAENNINNLELYTIDDLNDILSLKVKNDNTLLIITEKMSFTLEGIREIAELERFQLLINKYMNKENEGSN